MNRLHRRRPNPVSDCAEMPAVKRPFADCAKLIVRGNLDHMSMQEKLLFHLALICLVVVPAANARSAEPGYSSDVTTWEEIRVPPADENPERVVWDYASDYSKLYWRVYLDHGQPRAALGEGPDEVRQSSWPPFEPKADKFVGANRFAAVNDGWLVGFNHGEFGAALYWFSRDGRRHYLISNDHVVTFFTRPDGIYAIEGMAHMGASCGSLIRVARATKTGRWQAERFVRLPFAPDTIALQRNGNMIIALTDSLVSVTPDGHITTLIADAPWWTLSPATSVILPDDSKLYLGMVQYVGEVDLTTNKLRMLVPSKEFLNKLPDDDEQRLRTLYTNGMGHGGLPADFCEQMEERAKAWSLKRH